MTTTTAAFEFTLDELPPGVNNAYRTIAVNGIERRVLTGRARKWKADAIKQIRVAANRRGWSLAKKTPMKIAVLFMAPNIFVWDLDGKMKLLQDAFCEACGLDDRYVIDLAMKKERHPRAHLVMRVAEVRTT